MWLAVPVPKKTPELLTLAQVAEALGRPLRTVQEQVKSGRIPARKLHGQTTPWLVEQAVVDRIKKEAMSPAP